MRTYTGPYAERKVFPIQMNLLKLFSIISIVVMVEYNTIIGLTSLIVTAILVVRFWKKHRPK